MSDWNTPGGKARAATATRGNGGQFLPDKPSDNPAPAPAPAGAPRRRSSRSLSKGLTLKSLDIGGEWWAALAAQYPRVNLHAELLKALDWHGAANVKSPKLFFRNWVERAKPTRLVVLSPSIEEQLAARKR